MKILHTTLIALFTLCFVSCGEKKAAEDTATQILESFKTIPDIIQDVTDVETAKLANEKLSQLGKDINLLLIANKDKKVSKPKYDEMMKNQQDLFAELQKTVEKKIASLTASDPAAAQELDKGFKQFATNMTANLN